MSAKTFDAAVDKMFLFLELLSYGYQITGCDWKQDEDDDDDFDPNFLDDDSDKSDEVIDG